MTMERADTEQFDAVIEVKIGRLVARLDGLIAALPKKG